VRILRNKSGAPEWTNLKDLLMSLRTRQADFNNKNKNDTSMSRQQWLDPIVVTLNGTPCIEEYVKIGDDPRGRLIYYFLFSNDRAIEIDLSLIDNSTRPGLPRSDWRPRAEALVDKLKEKIRFEVLHGTTRN